MRNQNKPVCSLIIEDGDISNYANLVKSCLESNKQVEFADEFAVRTSSCKDYEDIILLSLHYIILRRVCPVCRETLNGKLIYIGKNKRGEIYSCDKCRTQFNRETGTGNVFKYNS